jgi:DNA-binding winged helix-turn-helix (wHTH) protein
MRLAFGDCVFDSLTRELRRAGAPVALAPKSFQLLELLLRHRPQAMSRAEIQDALWPSTYVSFSNLSRVAADLRRALGDDARRPRYLRTLHGFGYAFAGEVADEAAPVAPKATDALACRVVFGQQEILLGEGTHVLGRSPEAQVFIDSTRVSRHHARIVVAQGRATLEDMGSKNGTFHRGERLRARAELADGDLIGVGPVLLKFRSPRDPSSTETDVAR